MNYAFLALFGLMGMVLLSGCTQAPERATANPLPAPPQAPANVSANASQSATANTIANATGGASPPANASQMPTRCMQTGPGVYIGGGTITINGVTYRIVQCQDGTSCDPETWTCQ